MMKRLIVAVLMMISMASTAVPASAASSPVTQVAICSAGAANFFGFQPWYACLPKNSDGTPKLTKLTDIFLIIFPVVDWIMKAAVFIAAGMMFVQLFKIATSRGNASQYGTAIGGVRDAVIGLVISVLAVAILNFVSGAFY